MSKQVANRDAFLAAVEKEYGAGVASITRKQVIDLVAKYRLTWPAWFVNDPERRSGRGEYSMNVGVGQTVKAAPRASRSFDAPTVPVTSAPVEIMPEAIAAMAGIEASPNLMGSTAKISLVPPRAAGYVPFGYFNDVRMIIKSNKFYPVFVTGLSGNGKTMMVEQVCAQEGRECIRANITIETDEDDLLGGFRLIDGRTVWQNGPVVMAMERGAVLLLDEVDLGSNKLMCLQPVLEGKPVFLKKINRVVVPAVGFEIIATANTKGKGSDDGRFIGTNVLNEAFLERFSITLEQEYPSIKVEAKILNNLLKLNGIEDKEFVEKLVLWGDITRSTFKEGALSEVISTRRLVHIIEAYVIFGKDRQKAIQLCLNRFDDETKKSFMDLYAKLDESVTPGDDNERLAAMIPADDDIPF